MNDKLINKAGFHLLWIVLAVFVGGAIILNLTPPVSRDALIHHLAVPKLWLKHGGFYETPWAPYSYYPMYIDLLYLLCLYFGSDIAPKFIHIAFGLATAALIYIYLKQKMGRPWGLLGAVIFVTTPIVFWLSTAAYVDLGMTFFTTASVLCFIRWRDAEFRQLKWLLISSFCMGMAIGSKYNALIALLIMCLMVTLIYAHDTRKQATAVGYGLFFLIGATLVASPWYVKNYILTHNPFYPLFEGLFASLHQQPVQKAIQTQVKESTGAVSFFKMREVLYGESFWETLLIPIRMFFQGKDDSYRYFQGVLNPILIIFSPFILMNKSHAKDKFCFVLFSLIFVFMAFFLTHKQVRYILPVIPFLAVLAVMGIKNLSDRFETGGRLSFSGSRERLRFAARLGLYSGIAALLGMNILYLKARVQIVRPWPYIFRQESRQDFLKRHLPHYEAVAFVNANLPADARVFLIFLGRRGYYLERSYKNEPGFGRYTLDRLVRNSKSEESFFRYAASRGVTHILMRADLVDRHLKENFSEEDINRFARLVKKHWKLLYDHNAYALWDIRM